MDKRDYYEVLGVGRDATSADLKRAFRKLAQQYHPDVNKDGDAEERFKEIAEAYEVLSDDDKRAAYDRFGHAGVSGMGGAGYQDFGFGNVADIFEEFFGASFGGRRRRRNGPRRGADLRYDLNISFEEAFSGDEREIEIRRSETCTRCAGSGAEPGTQPERCEHCSGSGEVRRVQQSILGSFVNVTACPICNGAGEVVPTPCSECNGRKQVQRTRRLKVRIPPGVDDDTQIRLTGEGEPGIAGGPAGNLYVVLHVKRHEFFQRQGDDVVLNMEINVAQAALGDEISVPTPDGGETVLTVVPGTQSGKVFRLNSMGMPRLQRSGHGDLLVVVQVVVPSKLTEEQRRLFQELAPTFSDKAVIAQREKGFFSQLKDALGF